jgi:hypothetical protein
MIVLQKQRKPQADFKNFVDKTYLSGKYLLWLQPFWTDPKRITGLWYCLQLIIHLFCHPTAAYESEPIN